MFEISNQTAFQAWILVSLPCFAIGHWICGAASLAMAALNIWAGIGA